MRNAVNSIAGEPALGSICPGRVHVNHHKAMNNPEKKTQGGGETHVDDSNQQRSSKYEDPPADLTESVGTESKGKGTAEPVMTNIRIC